MAFQQAADEDIVTPATRYFETKRVDNMTVNDDAMLTISSGEEDARLTSERDALLDSTSTFLCSRLFRCVGIT